MQLVFVSNYFNHHQKPLSDALYSLTDGKYKFISTTPMRDERKKLGYSIPNANYNFISYLSDETRKQAIEMINSADVVIFGSADYSYIKQRIKSGKLTFKYGERALRNGIEPAKYIPRLIKWNSQYPHSAPVYLLASSAYAAWDYSRLGMFKNKVYKWAYFTEIKKYDNLDKMFINKRKNSILWVARLIELKHPEHIIETVRRLKAENYDISLKIIGNGILEDRLRRLVNNLNLSSSIEFCGAMSPEEVRINMEQSEIFAFTSNKLEGWGAVVNEAMNSGCAVVGSHEVGSVPFLIKDGLNGLIYQSGNVDMLFEKIRYLLDNPSMRESMGRQAYASMTNLWNADIAAKRFVSICKKISEGSKFPEMYEDGPCSKAEIITEQWYKQG